MRIIYYDFGDGFLADHHLFHAIDELTRKGHEVIYVNPMKEIGGHATTDACCELLWSRVKAEHDNGGVDLFFSVGWDSYLTPETVKDISGLGIPTVSFSTDDLSHPFRVEKITHAFDLCWTATRESVGILKGYGAKKVIAMPFAANPHWYKPINVPEQDCICFIGTAYGARARGIATLAQAHVPVHVHGASPMDVYGKNKGNPITRAMGNFADASERFIKGMKVPGGRKCIQAALVRSMQELVSSPPEKDPMKGTVEYLGSAGFEDMAQIFSQSALSFGSIEIASTHVLRNPLLFIRVREFEVAMSGGVHLVNRHPELEEYFEDESEMVYYDSLDELVEKARFYLAPERKTARDKIRAAAVKRAVGEHTWSHRFEGVGKALGIAI
jgi:hypothetical protein